MAELIATSSVEDFVSLLNDLRTYRGLSYRAVSRRARQAGHELPPTTVYDMLTRSALPRVEALRAYLLACDVDESEARHWLAARGRLAGARGPAATTGPAAPGPAELVPRQLPPDVDLIGRAELLSQLRDWLADRDGSAVCAVVGVPGVGKSALAVAAAHRAAALFPAGQLFLDLRGHAGRPVDAATALDHCLRALGVAGADIPLETGQRSALLRTRLADRRVLLVLDNAVSAEQLRPLLPGSPSCRTIVTSRHDLGGLAATHDVHHIRLEPLPTVDAIRVLEAAPDTADKAVLAEIAELCGGLPLALRVAAAHRRTRPERSLHDLRDSLLADRLAVLEVDDDPATSVRAAFQLSWSALTDDERRLLRRTALQPSPVVDARDCAALAGLPVAHARRSCERLVSAGLLRPADAVRYRVHDLIREYAGQRCRDEDSPADRHDARLSLLDAALTAVEAAMDRVDPHRRRLPGRPVPDRPADPLRFADLASATAWLDLRRAELADLVRMAAPEHPAYAVHLAHALWRYHLVGLHTDDWVSTHEVALTAADRLGDPTARAHLLSSLAGAYTHSGRSAQAVALYQEVIALTRAAGDTPGEAVATGNLGSALHRLGELAQAQAHYRAARPLFAAHGDRRNEALTLSNMAEISLLWREHAAAARGYAEVLATARALRDTYAESGALIGLGLAAREQGDHAAAHDHLSRALDLATQAGDHHDMTAARLELAVLALRRGDVRAARRRLADGLALTRETGDPNLLAAALNHSGDAALADGAADAATAAYREALELASAVGDRLQQARAHQGLAGVHHAGGRAAAARHEAAAAQLFAALGIAGTGDPP